MYIYKFEFSLSKAYIYKRLEGKQRSVRQQVDDCCCYYQNEATGQLCSVYVTDTVSKITDTISKVTDTVRKVTDTICMI